MHKITTIQKKDEETVKRDGEQHCRQDVDGDVV